MHVKAQSHMGKDFHNHLPPKKAPTTKDHQRPPETIGDEMGSSHIYFVVSDYTTTGCMTGG